MAKGKGINLNLPSVDELFSTQEERDEAKRESVRNIPIAEITDFPNHPFKVKTDENMLDMVESVKEHGVLVPALVREKPEGGYEMVAGHRRKMASELAEKKEMPCIVRNLTDDEAILIMVDSNLQREKILPSEKAFAYKMKLDAVDRVKGRPKKEGQVVPNYQGKKSSEVAAEGSGESYKQVERYIRLTFLIKPILGYVDEKRIAFGTGVELSYLEPEGQEQLYQVMKRLCVFPNLVQAKKLKELGKEGKLDENGMEIVLSDEKPAAQAVRLQRKKLNEYFPADYSAEQMEEVIYGLLKKWKFEQGDLQKE